jgi:hypothetical protein
MHLIIIFLTNSEVSMVNVVNLILSRSGRVIMKGIKEMATRFDPVFRYNTMGNSAILSTTATSSY